MFPRPEVFPASYELVCTAELHESYAFYGPKTSFYDFFHNSSEKDETWFWNMFARPVEGAVRNQQLWNGHTLWRDRSLLERLPTELIDHILDSLVDQYDIPWKTRHDILALALSSKILYPLVLAHIHRSQAKQQPPSSFARKPVSYTTKGFDSHMGNDHITEIHRFPSQSDQEWYQSIAEVREKWNVLDEKRWGEWTKLEQDVSRMYMYPQDRVWVLRNFTTRQIVRSDMLMPPSNIVPVEARLVNAKPKKGMFRRLKNKLTTRHRSVSPTPNLHLAPTLPQVFLIRAVCADTRSVLASESKFHFHEGVWNGHAFDVVTLEQHARDISASTVEWTDVSASAAADVGHLRWCVGQAEIAKTWPEYEEQLWEAVISRDRQKWRLQPEKALRELAS